MRAEHNQIGSPLLGLLANEVGNGVPEHLDERGLPSYLGSPSLALSARFPLMR